LPKESLILFGHLPKGCQYPVGAVQKVSIKLLTSRHTSLHVSAEIGHFLYIFAKAAYLFSLGLKIKYAMEKVKI
jgi:hypothetical protein